MNALRIFFAATAIVGATAGQATIMTTLTTPSGAKTIIGAGAEVSDFESIAPGDYASVTDGNLTITPDNGHAFADSAYAASYNNFGKISVHNCYCGTSFGALTFTFAAPVMHFGFFFGASDTGWTLSTYNGGTPLDTAVIGPTFASNLGNFYYSLNGPITKAILVGDSSDYIFVDNVTYSAGTVSGTVPEPASWALMIAGFGLVGAALRRRVGVGSPVAA